MANMNNEMFRNLINLKAKEETARAKRFRILEAECPGIKKATEALEGFISGAQWPPLLRPHGLQGGLEGIAGGRARNCV